MTFLFPLANSPKITCNCKVTAFLGTLFLGVLMGILVSVGLSLIIVIYESARPQITILWRIPGTSIYRNMKQESSGTFIQTLGGVCFLGWGELSCFLFGGDGGGKLWDDEDVFVCVIWFDVFWGGVVVFVGIFWKSKRVFWLYRCHVQVYRLVSKWKLLNCDAYFALAYGLCIVNWPYIILVLEYAYLCV